MQQTLAAAAVQSVNSAIVELEQSSIEFKPSVDKRPPMPEPPPVWLVAVEDVRAPAPAGVETLLDAFYSGLLKFEREATDAGRIVYKAANFRLCFEVLEPPIARADFRPIGVEVPSLTAILQQLIDQQIEYMWQRGLLAGQDTLLLQDPAGNWVALAERREVG